MTHDVVGAVTARRQARRGGGAVGGTDQALRVVSTMTTHHMARAIVCTVASADMSGTVI
jgi:hypothetical protein